MYVAGFEDAIDEVDRNFQSFIKWAIRGPLIHPWKTVFLTVETTLNLLVE